MTIQIDRRRMIAASAATLFGAAAAPALAQGGVNGRNVTSVKRSGGRMAMGPLGAWTERGDDGVSFQFRETGRDDWSVYLVDSARNVKLQLDLHRRQIRYAADDGPFNDLYPITGVSAEVNGRNAARVEISGGYYRMTGARAWEERGSDGNSFQFTEDRRDDWSIYLVDASRGVRLQLDLHTRKVMYSDSGASTPRPLYDITGSSAFAR